MNHRIQNQLFVCLMLACLLIALLFSAMSARAQYFGNTPITITNVPALVGSNTATNVPLCILRGFPQNKGFAVEHRYALFGAGNSNTWVKGFGSIDGTNYSTNVIFSLGSTAAAGVPVDQVTNIPPGAYAGFRSIAFRFDNANSMGQSNYFLKAGIPAE